MHITHIATTVPISVTGHGTMVDNYNLLFLIAIHVFFAVSCSEFIKNLFLKTLSL